MRLIRSKIYRAFPELDRFGDDQCLRFVIAANSSWLSRGIRWTVVCAMGLAALFGGTMLTGAAVMAFKESDSTLAMLVGGMVLVGTTLGGMVGALVSRDGLLRRRVRRMIAECGSCSRCRYSLLGIRVGEDLQVVCPECGTPREVDAAIGELATDERGGRVFAPQGSRVDSLERERLRVRRKRLARHGLIVGGALAVVVMLVVGGVGGFLYVQARAADKHADLAAAWRETRRARGSVVPGMTEAEREREWESFLSILAPVVEIQTQAVEDPQFSSGLSNAWPDPDALSDGATARLDASWGKGAAAKIRAMVLEVVARNAKAGNVQRFEALRALRSPVRPIVLDPTGTMEAPEQVAFSHIYALVNLDLARMTLAARAGDRAEHGQAIGELVELARVIDGQDTLMDHWAGVGIRMRVAKLMLDQAGELRDDKWLAEARARLDSLGEGPDMGGILKTWKTLDDVHIAKFFSEMKRSGLSIAGVLPEEYAYATRSAPVGPFQIGTYWSNVRAGERVHDELVAQAKKEAWERGRTGATTTGRPLVDWMMVWGGQVISRRDEMVREVRRARIRLAAAEFAMRSGRAAKNVSELADMLPEKRTVFDPFTNKPFELRVPDENATALVVAPSDGKPAANAK